MAAQVCFAALAIEASAAEVVPLNRHAVTHSKSSDAAAIGATPPPLHHETEGLNERMDEIQAAVLRVKLADVQDSIAIRRGQAAMYASALDSIVEIPVELPAARHAYRNYVIHVNARDRVRDEMTARGIATALSYAPPLHLQPVYAWKGCARGAFPVAERSGDRLLGLPIGPHLEEAQIAIVSGALRAAIAAAT